MGERWQTGSSPGVILGERGGEAAKEHTHTEAMQEANPQNLVLVCLSVMAGF